MGKKIKFLFGLLFSVMFAISCFFVAACSNNNKPGGGTGGTGETGGETGGGNGGSGNTGGETGGSGGNGGENDKPEDKYDGLFAAEGNVYTLNADYTITEKDVKATEGKDCVQLSACTFNLNGYTLDLNNYELYITSQGKDVVTFTDGVIKGGKLNVSVPNGDISFKGATIADTVDYELEAASETITFSNARLSGAGKVKSNSNVKIEYSSITDITLAGNGTLTAGSGAELGAVTVAENASGAKVTIAPTATVSSVALQAAAEVSVAGKVAEVKVAEEVKNDSNATLKVNVAPTAEVDKVELHAAAEVTLQGKVSAVTVAEAVKNDNKTLTVNVLPSAEVAKVELKAAADVTVEGKVSAVKVDEAVNSDSAELKINVAQSAEVAKVELMAKAQVEVSGRIENVVAEGNAQDAKVDIKETASVAQVVVKAEGVKLDALTAVSVVVAETVKNIETAVDYVTKTEQELAQILEHKHIYVIDSTVAATCTEDGKKIYKCIDGDDTKEEIILALGHSKVYSVVKQPTATEKGVGRYTCIRCGHTEEVEINNVSSFTVEGVEYLFSLIPDGVYNVCADTTDLFTLTIDNNQFEIKAFDGVIKVENGNVKGTLKFEALVSTVITSDTTDYKSTGKVNLTCVIDNDSIACNMTMQRESEQGEYYLESGESLVTISGLIKTAVMAACGFDVDEIGVMVNEYLPYFGTPDEGDKGEILDKINSIVINLPEIEFFTKTQDNDGNTVYTLNVDGLKKYVDDLGKKTPKEVIEDYFGQGTYTVAYAFLKTVPDMKVSEVNAFLDVILGSVGLGDGQLVNLLQAVLNNVAGDTDKAIDLNALIEQYKDYNVMEAVALIMNNVQLPDNMPGMPSDTPNGEYPVEGDIVKPFALTEVDAETKQAAAALKEQYLDYLEMINTIATESTVAEAITSLGFDYTQIAGYIDMVNSLVSFEYTVDAANAVIAYSFSFMMDEATFVTVVKTVEDAVPSVNVSLMGVVAGVTGTADGIQATLNAFGFTVEALISETQNNGVKVDVSLPMGDGVTSESISLADVTITVDPTEYGKKISVDGKVAAELFVNSKPESGVETATEDNGEELSYVEFGGSFNVEKNNGAAIDEDLLNSFDGIKSALYHMNATLQSKYDGLTQIKFVSDESGEYYIISNADYRQMDGYYYENRGIRYYLGTVQQITKTVRVEAVNGLPECIISTNEDCGDWVRLLITCQGKGEITAVTSTGLFVINDDGTYTLAREDAEGYSELTIETDVPVSVYASGYYNLKTGASALESQHKLTHTAKLVDGAKVCDDGLLVTTTCSECDYKSVNVHYDHYNEKEETILKTQCGKESKITVYTCIYCGIQKAYFNSYEHAITQKSYEIVTAEEYAKLLANFVEQGVSREEVENILKEQYMLVSDLPAELDTNGFYHGCAIVNHCVNCGLNVTEITYYTNIAEKGCLSHSAYLCEYKGNQDYEGFTKLAKSAAVGHYASGATPEVITDSAQTIEQIKALVGKLPFTVTAISAEVVKCDACGIVRTRTYLLRGGEITNDKDGDYIELVINYNDDGTIDRWNYSGYVYALENIKALYEGLPVQPLSGATYGEAYVSADSNYRHLVLRLYGSSGAGQYVDMYDYGAYGDLTVSNSDGGCTEIVQIYEKTNGLWQLISEETNVNHYFNYETISHGICSEDGYTIKKVCLNCGYEEGNTYYEHNLNRVNVVDADLSELALSAQLPGLSAKVSYEWVCFYDTLANDNTTYSPVVGNCTLTLTDNWTLTSDVYFKAEGLTIDLNGYSIDLNGYNLALYSYDGNSLALTDSTYDTSAPESVTNGIIDSAEEGSKGLLVVFTKNGDIAIGTIAIETEKFLSDTDDRKTIADSVLAECQKDLSELLNQSAANVA